MTSYAGIRSMRESVLIVLSKSHDTSRLVPPFASHYVNLQACFKLIACGESSCDARLLTAPDRQAKHKGRHLCDESPNDTTLGKRQENNDTNNRH